MTELQKSCPDCGETKPATEFDRNRSLKDGLSFYCSACNRARSNAWYRRHRAARGKQVRDLTWVPQGFRWCPNCQQAVAEEDYVRNSGTASGFGSRCRECDRAANSAAYFYRKYKLTPRALAELRAAQGDRCAICGDVEPEHLDHDHDTGRIRELLCQRCNQGLGQFKDDPHVLRAAAEYVERHRDRQARETAKARPEAASRPETPPVGSKRRPSGMPRHVLCSRGRARLAELERAYREADG